MRSTWVFPIFLLIALPVYSQIAPFGFWNKPEAPSTSGNFFVLTSSTNLKGDLNGLQGAHKICFDELNDNNWKDKATVTLHGGTVWAWLCDSNGCENLSADTTYTYARAGSATAGGNTFTTNGSGRGPGDTTQWSNSTRFGNSSSIWTGRNTGSSTLFPTTDNADNCNDWLDADASNDGRRGAPSATSSGRWSTGVIPCSNSARLVCFVDDDGESGDKVPAALNWTDFSDTSNTQTFTSITGNVGIELRVTNLVGTPEFQFKRNSSPWQNFNSSANYPLGVKPGDTLQFRFETSQPAGVSGQIDIINVSSGHSTLDTVTGTKANKGHYFVLSASTTNGSFGGLSGINSTCLTDLRTQSWNGKGSAALTTSTVQAWMCDGSSCQNLANNTEYFFAKMGATLPEPASFTTNSSGKGPGDDTSWHTSNYFAASSQYYWTGRATGSSTSWSNSSHSNHCLGWTNSSGSNTGRAGYSNNSGTNRWGRINYPCDDNLKYVCLVEDDGTSDVTTDVIDWTDFLGTSSSQAISVINTSIDLELSVSYVSGSPTIEYRKNGGSWTAFTPGSPATVSMANTNTLEFRVTGTSLHSADITITNLSLGDVVIDTTRGTVP